MQSHSEPRPLYLFIPFLGIPINMSHSAGEGQNSFTRWPESYHNSLFHTCPNQISIRLPKMTAIYLISTQLLQDGHNCYAGPLELFSTSSAKSVPDLEWVCPVEKGIPWYWICSWAIITARWGWLNTACRLLCSQPTETDTCGAVFIELHPEDDARKHVQSLDVRPLTSYGLITTFLLQCSN